MQSITGKIISNKGKNTVIVAVETIVVHPLYKKRLRRTLKIAAHTFLADLSLGDTVLLVACRPMSRTKHFLVKEVVNKTSNAVIQSPSNPVTKGKAASSKELGASKKKIVRGKKVTKK